MNPFPLSSPDGRIFAYVCSGCNSIASIGHRMDGKGPTEDDVKFSEKQANRCCMCQRCYELPTKKSDVFYGERFCETCKPIAEKEEEENFKKYEIERTEREKIEISSLELSKDKDIAISLKNLMSDISEEHWCAGWLIDLEFSLWDMINNGNKEFGMGEVRENQVSLRKSLSDKAGGWWYYDKNVSTQLFSPLNKWKEIYSKYTPDPEDRELSEEEFNAMFPVEDNQDT